VFRYPTYARIDCDDICGDKLQQNRTERSFEHALPSPDGKYIVILGQGGFIIVLSNLTKQWIGEMKMNATCRTAAFTPDGRFLFTGSGESIGPSLFLLLLLMFLIKSFLSTVDGQVYQWDMNTRKCVHKYADEGSLKVTSLAISPDGAYQAIG